MFSATKPNFLRVITLLLLIQFIFCDYSHDEAHEYASASALAYCEPMSIHSWECGLACNNLTSYQHYYSGVFNLSLKETISFSMIYNPSSNKFITSFRGTVGKLELLTEILQGGAMAYGLSEIPNALVDSFFYQNYIDVLRPVFIEKIQDAFASFPNYKFVFTGHSLGGAFATLASFDVVSSSLISSDQTVLYTYGSPRIGNYALAQAIEAVIPEIYRVVHWNDVVPHLPPCVFTLTENCVADTSDKGQHTMVGLWHAWHVSKEIFYDKDHSSYQVCTGEDKKCANQFGLFRTSVSSHRYYMGIHMHCDGVSVISS